MKLFFEQIKRLFLGGKTRANWARDAEQLRRAQTARNAQRKSGRKRSSIQERANEVESLLKDICREYKGAGKCHVQQQIAKGGRLENVIILHFIITEKPFRQLNGKAVLDALCSFSVMVGQREYALYKMWYDHIDPEADNWRTRRLSTTKLDELKQFIADEWVKGEQGEFFHRKTR
jgi:hypothetical protein